MKRWTLSLVLMLLVLVLCSPALLAQNEVIIGSPADARTLFAMKFIDLATHDPISNIYDPLITRDRDTMEYIGYLAYDWEVLDDLTWEFYLHEGIEFHNGAPFNADAVKFTIDYINDPDNEMAYRGRYANIHTVEVIDDYTVRFHTTDPMPILLDRLTSCYILEPGYVQEVGEEQASLHPVGTGPYEFVRWDQGREIVMEAFANYWLGAPEVERVVFRPIPEFSTRVAALLVGEIHVIRDVPGHMVQRVDSAQRTEVRGIPSSRVNYIALVNFQEGPLQDKKVRQAFNYAVNVPELIEYVLDGSGTQMAGSLAVINPEHDPTLTPYPYDPDKAIAMIQEAGYEPEEIKLVLDTPDGRYPQDREVAMAIADELGAIGIQVDVRVNEWGTHLDRIINRNTGEMFLLGWGPAFNAQGTIESLMTTERTYSGFGLPYLDELVAEAVYLVEPEAMVEAWNEIQQIVYDEAPWIFLWQQHDLWGVNQNLDWTPRADERVLGFEMRWMD